MDPSEADKFIPHAVTPLVVEEHVSNGHTKPVIQGTWTRPYTSAVHVLPTAITVVLLWMNHARVFWFPATGPSNHNISTDTVMNSLQLAAKLHEILIIASLAAMTLKVFKRQLVGSGLPLGLLTGGYRVGDLTYLVSSPFLWNISWLGGFLALSTIVATIVGPASAILMLPGLDWYSLPGAFDNIITPIMYNRYANQTWPSVVNSSLFNYTRGEICANRLESSYYSHCPAAGSVEISNWIAGWRESALSTGLSFQEPTASIRRELLLGTSPSGVTFATTVSAATVLSIGRFLNFMKNVNVGTIGNTAQFKLSTVDTSEIYQPLVQTKCSAYSRDELIDWQNRGNDSVALYPNILIACYGDDTCRRMMNTTWSMPAENWNQTDFQPEFSYTFLAPTREEDNSPLLLTLDVPYVNKTTVGTWIVGCTFMAHWVPTTVTISPSDSDIVESNITDLSVFYSKWDDDVPAGPAVKLEKSWLAYLDPKYNETKMLPNGTNTTQSTSYIGHLLAPIRTLDHFTLDNITNGFFNPGDTDIPDKEAVEQFFQKAFGAVLVEALSRTASNDSTYAIREKSQTKLVLSDMAQQWGYGVSTIEYDWSSGTLEVNYRNHTVPDNVLRESTEEDVLAELDGLVKYDFGVMRYGYGSGIPGPTLRFGLAVMYIYLVMVAIYAVVALWLRAQTVVAWSDLQDLLVLAWTSPAPAKLQETGAGMDKMAWLMSTKVKADSMGQTQLVGGDAQDLVALDMGKRYYYR